MHGLRWQAMETGNTAPSLDPTRTRLVCCIIDIYHICHLCHGVVDMILASMFWRVMDFKTDTFHLSTEFLMPNRSLYDVHEH